MFLSSSRYHKQKTHDAILRDGRTVKALSLRRLPAVSGKATATTGTDRLDVMAQRSYGNPRLFWHIADANTELEANDLIREIGRTIRVPEQ